MSRYSITFICRMKSSSCVKIEEQRVHRNGSGLKGLNCLISRFRAVVVRNLRCRASAETPGDFKICLA